ncbi:DNA cytosine methyltransferase [Acinetobacter sp. 'aerobic (ED)']|uniref:DNA cytosine methyltransferase n=1 Tax=Acinetobacter sp. 'aerobic (ED)' TaxID=174230 RepID=UPI00192B0A6D|nr:DNA cytosine methyltransferase [Acinetobacter sp. 'aerobic (ED)']
MNELALFAGAGGGILGSHLMGCTTACAVERDAYAAQVLAQRQNDGILPAFPIWSDIKSFDGRPWRGIIDVISGGFPCQDISSAGKGAGINGERSGLWSEMARIISEVRPGEVWVENSPMLVSRGLARVISDLAQMGYDAHWARFSASNFGAPHIRDRIWIVAYSQSFGREQGREAQQSSKKWVAGCSCQFSNTDSERLQGRECLANKPKEIDAWGASPHGAVAKCSTATNGSVNWWTTEPGLGRVVDGVAHRVDRLKAIGNGQVPVVAKSAFEFLGAGL